MVRNFISGEFHNFTIFCFFGWPRNNNVPKTHQKDFKEEGIYQWLLVDGSLMFREMKLALPSILRESRAESVPALLCCPSLLPSLSAGTSGCLLPYPRLSANQKCTGCKFLNMYFFQMTQIFPNISKRLDRGQRAWLLCVNMLSRSAESAFLVLLCFAQRPCTSTELLLFPAVLFPRVRFAGFCLGAMKGFPFSSFESSPNVHVQNSCSSIPDTQ